MRYAVAGRFNKKTGKYETKVWDKPQERDLRQLSHYFDVDEYQRVRAGGAAERPKSYDIADENSRKTTISRKQAGPYFRKLKEERKRKKLLASLHDDD